MNCSNRRYSDNGGRQQCDTPRQQYQVIRIRRTLPPERDHPRNDSKRRRRGNMGTGLICPTLTLSGVFSEKPELVGSDCAQAASHSGYLPKGFTDNRNVIAGRLAVPPWKMA